MCKVLNNNKNSCFKSNFYQFICQCYPIVAHCIGGETRQHLIKSNQPAAPWQVPLSGRVCCCRPKTVVRRPCSGPQQRAASTPLSRLDLSGVRRRIHKGGGHLARSVDARKLWRATHAFTSFIAFSGLQWKIYYPLLRDRCIAFYASFTHRPWRLRLL